MKCGIYHSEKFLRLIVLHSSVDVHSCLAVFMSGKILDRLRINTSIQKIGDVGMPQQVRCHIEVQAIHNVRIVFLMPSETRFDRVPDTLSIYILIIGALFSRANNNVLP